MFLYSACPAGKIPAFFFLLNFVLSTATCLTKTFRLFAWCISSRKCPFLIWIEDIKRFFLKIYLYIHIHTLVLIYLCLVLFASYSYPKINNTINQLLFHLILISWTCWAPSLTFCLDIFSIIQKNVDRNVLAILVCIFLVQRLPPCNYIAYAGVCICGQVCCSIAQGACG